jgi:hypothetical protein
MDFKDAFIIILDKRCRIILYERVLLYNIFIRSFFVVNFNVSSTKLMHMLVFLDTSSMGVTIWYQSRSIQIVPWAIKLQLR